MSSTGPNDLVLNLMPTFGAVLVGSFLSAALWGVSSLQTFLYFMKYDSDPGFLKLLVASLWTLDTANEVLVIKSNFRVLILNWGGLAGLDQQQLELMDHTLVEAIVVFAVQLYFIWRIYIFSRKRWLFLACLVVLSSWQVVGTIIYQVYGYGRLISTLYTPREVGLNMSLRAAAAAVDILVTISMVYLLRQNTPEFDSSRRMIQRLIVLSINSGMVTAIVASAVLILLAAQPQNLYYCIPEHMLCSLYFSTFLANLNARRYVTGETEVNTILHTSGSTGNMFPLSPRNKSSVSSPATTTSEDRFSKDSHLVVKVRTEAVNDLPYTSEIDRV